MAAQRARPARRRVALDGSDQGLTVAVTGPTGEIGKPFLAALERVPEVERVIGMARRPFDIAAHGWEKVEYRRGDVLDRDSVDALVEDADVVVHLAFVIVAGKDESREINLRGSRNVFEAAAAAGAKRLVYTSSVAAYGFDRDLPELLTEEDPVRGSSRHPYSAHKAEVEAELAEALAGSGHRRLRLPALHRRRPRRDPAARPDPAGRDRRSGCRARCAGRWAGRPRCGRSCPTPACPSSSSTTTTSPRRSAPP